MIAHFHPQDGAQGRRNAGGK